MTKLIKTINIQAKHSDMYFAGIDYEDGTSKEHEGYGLYITGLGGGDYIDFTIDNATGKIMGWVPLTEEKIEELL